jgi:dimethylhistidine N-methyltransferase
MPAPFSIVEFGSGSAKKTRHLIRAALKSCGSLVYSPIDISGPSLRSAAKDLVRDFGRLHVAGIVGEYLDALGALAPTSSPRMFVFLGSNLGNFGPEEGCGFLSRIASTMQEHDRFLLGIDLAKDRETIELAYNDSAGVTAQFNKNILARINRELGGGFDLGAFSHEARYVPAKGHIAMKLVSQRAQVVPIDGIGRKFAFEEGEAVTTEHCHKYSFPSFDALCCSAGLRRVRTWSDDKGWFASVLLARAS